MKYLALASALLFPAMAAAEPLDGLYGSAALGPNFDNPMLTAYKQTKVDTDAGPAVAATIGWRFSSGLRTEIEGGYRSNDVANIFTRRANGSLLPLSGVGGDAETPAVMANVAYDIPVHPFGLPLRPYVGLGVGYAWLDFNGTHGDGFGTLNLPQHNTFTGPVNVGFGSAGAFAYQAMLGAAWPLQHLHGVELTLDYRFLGTARENLALTRTALGGDTVNGAVPTQVAINHFHEQNSALMIGVRYKFGAK